MAAKNDKLVQTRLKRSDYNYLVKEADREGISVAAYLRRLVIRDRRQKALIKGQRGWR
jgi:hypothetical protein